MAADMILKAARTGDFALLDEAVAVGGDVNMILDEVGGRVCVRACGRTVWPWCQCGRGAGCCMRVLYARMRCCVLPAAC